MHVRDHFVEGSANRPVKCVLGALVASTVYLIVSALELVLARGAHRVAGTENIDER